MRTNYWDMYPLEMDSPPGYVDVDDEQFEQCPECVAYSLWPDGWCANCEKYIFGDEGDDVMDIPEADEVYGYFDNYEGEQ